MDTVSYITWVDAHVMTLLMENFFASVEVRKLIFVGVVTLCALTATIVAIMKRFDECLGDSTGSDICIKIGTN